MIAKRQHWVPRLLLRQFTAAPHLENPAIEVFDVSTRKRFKTSIMNVAQEKHFYNTRDPGDGEKTLETWLGKQIEGPTLAPLSRLLRAKDTSILTDEERLVLARFVVTLAVRDRRSRAEIEDFPSMLLEFFDARGEKLAEGLRRDLEAEVDADAAAIHNAVIKDVAELAPQIARMSWGLGSPPPGREFCSSDNPVVRFNTVDADPYGNLGLLCRGIQLHLALSPELVLAIVNTAGPVNVNQISVLSEKDLLAYNAALAANASKFLFSRAGDFDFRDDMRTGGLRTVIG